MSSVFVASQSGCFFLRSREQIRLVENRLPTSKFLGFVEFFSVEFFEFALIRSDSLCVHFGYFKTHFKLFKAKLMNLLYFCWVKEIDLASHLAPLDLQAFCVQA
jgi:hypothetical protein